MKRVFAFLLLLIFCFSMTGCKDSGSILANPTISGSNADMVKQFADDLYGTSNSLTGFSIVGTESDKLRCDYIYNAFKDMGLSNVKKVPIMLNKWDYTGMVLEAYCNCADNSKLKMRLVGAYPSNFDYDNEIIVLRYLNDPSKLTREYIENYAVLLPIYTNFEELNAMIEKVSSYNPALIVVCTTHTTTTNLYEVNTNYIKQTDIPVFTLPYNSYSLIEKAILKSIEQETDFDLTLTGSSVVSPELEESNFVVGEIKGESAEVIYITSHYDSIHHNYMSSCISTGELLVIAKSLLDEGYRPYYTLRFVATTGHEWGLLGEGKNTGLITYLSTLSEKEKSKINSVLVLDGSYPFYDTIFTQTSVSSQIKEGIEMYNSFFFKGNSVKYINNIVDIETSLGLDTEANVWYELGIPVVLTSEMNNSRFIYNDTSADSNSLGIDMEFINYYISYYTRLIKYMSTVIY